jgi:predicted metal-binding protein
MTSKIEANIKLIAELHSAKAQSKTAVAKEIAVKETAKKIEKIREVTDFLKTKVSDADVTNSKLKTVVEMRSYRVAHLDKDDNTLYNATMYVNAETQKLELFTQKISDTLTLNFVKAQVSQSKFKADALRKAFKTCGGAFGDKIRKSLYALSYMTTHDAVNTKLAEVIAEAKAKNKLCVYYDINNNESKRVVYEFIKI